MILTNEDRIVKSLETIVSCMVKSNEMAGEALKKSQELFEANMAIMKSQIEIGHIPYKIELTELTEEILEGLDGT